MAELESIRRMPYSLEAEKAILGTVLMDPVRFDEISFLQAEEFYLPQHQQIFSALIRMFLDDRQVDVVTLIDTLTRMGTYTEGDAAKYITTLIDQATGASNIVEYAHIVRDKALLRALIDASQKISERAFSEVGDAGEQLAEAENSIAQIADRKYDKNFDHIRDAILRNYDQLLLLKNDPNALAGLRTNYEKLDRVLAGLGGGELIIVGARPGMGKTSFALNIACNIAKSTRKDVAIFSLEMRTEELSSRLLCSEALIDSYSMRDGKLSDDDWRRLGDAMSVLNETEIWIDDDPQITVTAMKTKLRKLKNLGLVVIDYLQMMHGEETKSRENRVLEIQGITNALKVLAKEFDVPVILCSQLSRGPKDQKSQSEEHRKPTLTDLRDSGAIEQDADVVMLLHRAEYYRVAEQDADELSDHEVCDCIVAKNRHGSTGRVRLAWYGKYFRFVTSDEREEQDASAQ